MNQNRQRDRAAESIPASIFRAYDIRGIAGEELTAANIELIGQAIGSEALDLRIESLLLGYDGRLSSPSLSQALMAGILASGCNVVDLGLIPTPLLYFASYNSACSSGVMLTASHNPASYNGVKIVFRHSCLADNQIQEIRQRIARKQLHSGQGSCSSLDIRQDYIDAVCRDIIIENRPRVVIDCGNAVPGSIAPALFTALGCEVIPLFCELDGSFPNHHPDPTVTKNLDRLAEEVVASGADLGVAFDGDGDRLGVVSERGGCIDADRLLMLLVKDIAPRYPGQPIIYDVKCSTRLSQLIASLGAEPVMHRSGHSFMKQKMQETGAPLGGEFAAHVFIKDRWYGYDDGLYTAARILELLSRMQHPASVEFADYMDSVSTPELKVEVSEDIKFELVRRIVELADFPGARIITLDGLRVEFDDGWGLVRASNTSAALLLRFEADTQRRLDEIKSQFRQLLLAADKSLEPGF